MQLGLAVLLLVGCHKPVPGAADERSVPGAGETCDVRSADHRRWKLLSGGCCQGVACGQGRAEGVHPKRFRQPSYRGTFEGGYMHGKGRLVYANHDEYRGTFRQGKRNGWGVLIHPNNAYRYEGQWKNDQKHGTGTEVWDGGRRCEGQFRHDQHDGQGKMTYPNGSSYSGSWSAGYQHGAGTMTTADGDVTTGRWVYGLPSRHIVGELGEQAYACSRNEDCVVSLLPMCVSSGCSPPCGRVVATRVSALNRRHRARYVRHLRTMAADECQSVTCLDCAQPSAPAPSTSELRARS